MTFSPKPEVLKAIPVSAVHAFLTRRGWVQKPSSRPRFRYYEHSEMCFDSGKRMSDYFPEASDSPDYPLSVLDFIENQSRFWDLDPQAVLTELQGGPLAEPVRTSVPA
jgi:hypothetical protein